MYHNIGLQKLKTADISTFTTKKGLKIRKAINPFVRKIVKFATKNKIILERYPALEKDVPYIFVSTHTFTEDIIATVQKLDRNAYILIGTTDQLEHNPQMYAAWINGMIYVDRYDKDNRHQAIDKMEYVLKSGTSVLIFAEGGYNNTENLLCPLSFCLL